MEALGLTAQCDEEDDDGAGVEEFNSPRSARSVCRGTTDTYVNMVPPERLAKVLILSMSIPVAARVCAPEALS